MLKRIIPPKNRAEITDITKTPYNSLPCARWLEYYNPKSDNLPATILFLLITRQRAGIRMFTERLSGSLASVQKTVQGS